MPRKPRGRSIAEFEQYQILIDEWHPKNYWGPECFGPGSSYEVMWICRKEGRKHVFTAPISWRTNAINNDQEHQGCVICSPRNPPGDVELLEEELACEWLGRINQVSAKSLSRRSSKLGLWRCSECDHEWRTKVTSRTCLDDQHCPACFARNMPKGTINLRRKVNKEASDLFDEDARQLRRNAGYDKRRLPRTYKVYWSCASQRHRWYESYQALKERHWLCPKCSMTLNDFPHLKKEFVSRLNNDRKSKEITIEKNSKLLITWRCSKNRDHVWKARLSNRIDRNSGCPYCAGRKVSSSNSLVKCFPNLAKEIHPRLNKAIEIKSLTVNSTKKIFWLAECGHTWKTQVRLRTQRGYGCPKCKHQKSDP